MNRIKLTIVINIILLITSLIFIIIYFNKIQKKEKKYIYKIVELKTDFGLKDTVLNYIKLHEGLKLKPYKCPGGYLTIGYGHKIKAKEYFNNITIEEAVALLKHDYEEAFKLSPDYLTYPKRLAIGHFIFSLGIGNFNKSQLKKEIENNSYIGTELFRWCYVNKKYYKSLKVNRLFELKLYYK